MITLRHILQLGRAGSWPLILLPVIVPYLINQPLFSVYTLWLFIATFLIQITTLAHNAVSDYQWDVKDPSKQHHPLISGSIPYEFAVRFTSWSLFILFLLLLATFMLFPFANHFYVVFFLYLGVVGGHCYNDFGFSKYTYISWVPITTWVCSLVGLGYFLGTKQYHPIIVYIILYYLFREWFQISYSGRVKDINTGERNELKLMGARCKKVMISRDTIIKKFHPGYSWIYACGLTFCESVVGLFIFFQYAYNLYTLPIIATLLVIGWLVLYRIVKPREYNHEKELVFLTLEEIIFIFMLPVILSPLIGYLEVAFILFFSLLWFVFVNKYLVWNTAITRF